jgi:spore coat protein A, manganese oxidase
MPKPVRRQEVVLGPAERAELIVDFASAAGESIELRSGLRHGARHPLGTHTYTGAMMQFRVDSRRLPDRTRIPRKLRPLPHWTKGVSHTPDRTWTISIGGAFTTSWLINGRTFNPAYADAHPKLGSTETWEIVNDTDVAHMIHMHLTDWYLLSRNGKPPPPWEDCLKETFYVFPRERLLVAGHFADYTGKFVIHCHMLDHEDHGLMSQFEVVKA